MFYDSFISRLADFREITPFDGGGFGFKISGDDFILLKKTPDGNWNIHQRYRRTDMPAELQVGLTVYTDYSTASRLQPLQQNTQVIKNGRPDLVAGFDYVQFRRPQIPAGLSGKTLSDPRAVSDAELLQFLGEHALSK